MDINNFIDEIIKIVMEYVGPMFTNDTSYYIGSDECREGSYLLPERDTYECKLTIKNPHYPVNPESEEQWFTLQIRDDKDHAWFELRNADDSFLRRVIVVGDDYQRYLKAKLMVA
jgi:hypothetical protein